MAIPITVPRLGWNMDEGIFVGWLKREGEPIHPGEPIFSLENEKATEEIESLDAGLLRLGPDAPQPGDRVAVGAIIGYLVEAGETITFSAEDPDRAKIENLAQLSSPSISPEEKWVKEKGEKETRLSTQPTISPRAQRVAEELGLDWTRLTGSGRTGRIRERDVRAAAEALPGATPSTAMPLSTLRRTIAERMAASSHTTAPVTLTTTADAGNLVNLRQQFQAAGKASGEMAPSYTDFLVKLTAGALQVHPFLNASWAEDRIVTFENVHIGIAMDTEAGLVVPVVRDVAALPLKQLAACTRDLVQRARQRKLKTEEMQGGTFTVTNLGAFGIDAFTPIINPGQCAILGTGRIQRRPAVRGEEIIIREEVTLSLTFDHRVVDGAPAARFLQTLRERIENPGPWLLA